jgi:hypothetical protein
MNFFLSLFKSKSKIINSTHNLIYNLSMEEIEKFEINFEKLSKNGKYESLILTSCILYRYNQNIDMSIYKDYFYKFLLDIKKEYDVKKSNSEIIDLISNRIKAYENIFNNFNGMDGIIYSILYEDCLSLNPSPSFNLPKVLACNMAYSVMYKDLRMLKTE